MKKYWILGCICVLSILFTTQSGCSTSSASVQFDIFSIPVEYAEQQISHTGLQTYVIKQKKSDITGSYLSIQTQKIQQHIQIQERVEKNILQTKKMYPIIHYSEQIEKNIKCKKYTIPSLLVVGDIQNTNTNYPLYFGQYFFIYKNVAYVITYSNREKNDIKKFLQSIQCID